MIFRKKIYSHNRNTINLIVAIVATSRKNTGDLVIAT